MVPLIGCPAMSRATTDPDIRTLVVALIFSTPPFALRFKVRMSSIDCAPAEAADVQTAIAATRKRKRRMKIVSLDPARQIDCDMKPYVRRRTSGRSHACVFLCTCDAEFRPGGGPAFGTAPG